MRKIFIVLFIFVLFSIPGVGQSTGHDCSPYYADYDITNPIASSVWEVGSTHSIAWDITCAPEGAWVGKIYLYDNNTGDEWDIMPEFSNQRPLKGFMSWTIPSDIPSGDVFDVNVVIYTGTLQNPVYEDEDYSDEFSIIGSQMSVPSSSGSYFTHPIGTLIVDNGTVYEIESRGIRPFASASAFFSHGYSFSDVVAAMSDDLKLPVLEPAKYADGDLIVDQGSVYIIWDGRKIGFVSREVFEGLGYSFKNVFSGDLSGYSSHGLISFSDEAHCCGTLINIDGTIYKTIGSRATGIKKAPIPSMSIFNSHKFRLDRVVLGNANDRMLPVENSPLGFRPGTLVSVNGGIYNIGSNQKTPYGSAEIFSRFNFRFDQAIPVGVEEVSDLPDGPGDRFDQDIADLLLQYPAQPNPRDGMRVANVKQIQTALELYFNDYNSYPVSLSSLVPSYMSAIPPAPIPADGFCTAQQNTYVYTQTFVGSQYNLFFCLGFSTDGLAPGVHMAKPGGIN